jgi:hypothetical protein
MTARFKDFGVGASELSKEPIVFKLHDEEFTCVPEIQGSFMLDIVKNSNSDDGAKTATIILEFFEGVLEDESFVRFNALIKDKHRVVKIDTLSEIVGWLISEYSGRPEEQPEA